MKKLVLATLAFCPLLLLVVWFRFYQDPTKENVILGARDYEQDKAHVTNDIARLARIKNDLKTVVDANSPTNIAFDAYADFFAGHKMFRNRYALTNYIESTTVEQMRLEFKKSFDIYMGGRVTNIVDNFAFKPLNIVLVNATEIPTNFFMGTKVKSVIAPNVTKIGDRAFEDCRQLTYLFTSNTVSIGEDAFKNSFGKYRQGGQPHFTWEVPGGVLQRVIKNDEKCPLTGLKVEDLAVSLPIVTLKIVEGASGPNSMEPWSSNTAYWAEEFGAYEEVSACALVPDNENWWDVEIFDNVKNQFPQELIQFYGGLQQCRNEVQWKYDLLEQCWFENGFYRWYSSLRCKHSLVQFSSVAFADGEIRLPDCDNMDTLSRSAFVFGDRQADFPSYIEIGSLKDVSEISARTFRNAGHPFPVDIYSHKSARYPMYICQQAFENCWFNDQRDGVDIANLFSKLYCAEYSAFKRSRGITDLVFTNGFNRAPRIYAEAFSNSELKQLTFEANPIEIADTAFIRFTNREERESTGILAAQSRHMTNVTFKACSIEDALQVSSGTTNKWYSFLPVGCEIVATNGTYTVQNEDVQTWPWHPKD